YAGATPRWLVDFERWFPGSAGHALEVNYRCPPAVVTAASNLLTRNAVRVAKAIRPGPANAGTLAVLGGGAGRPSCSAEQVVGLAPGGATPGDVAVLARVTPSLAPVRVPLRHRGVPVAGAVDRRFLQRGGVRAALSWLAMAAAPSRALP